MVLYDLRCRSGHQFEANLPSMFADNPPCPCGEETSRIPAVARMSGVADAGPSRDDMPNTWRGIGQGNPDAIRHWRTQMTRREKLEEKYPELAGDRRPVLAHEGVFANAPLRAGDPLASRVAEATFAPKPAPASDTKGTP